MSRATHAGSLDPSCSMAEPDFMFAEQKDLTRGSHSVSAEPRGTPDLFRASGGKTIFVTTQRFLFAVYAFILS